MRSRHFIVFFVVSCILTLLASCSRESPLKENVNLKNNHSRVFASTTNFENPQAFLDSLANTTANANDTLPDTLTVSINDTVYLMGVLPRNVDKIYRFQWNLTKKDGKDSIIVGDNATPQAWTYSETGVYYPLFIAFDGNNATDTAGTGTKQTYIKVIDTKPVLEVPSDTLWTRHSGNITFPITARDSFGIIKKVLIDLDASGKAEPKEWKFEKSEDEDDVYSITIKNDSTYIDSLGNQKIYVIVVDDDDNETMDSVNLHFNRLPKLSIISPEDGSRHYTSEGTFFFYYKGSDVDNPNELRYTIWAQKSLNGKPPATAFTDEDLVIKDYVLNMYEPRNAEGENVITLLNNPSKKLEGRIYWEMFATDGYDTVWMERIKTGSSTSRPWNFFIGKTNSSETSFTGVAKYEGKTNHKGIRVDFTDGNKIYDTYTDANGNYTIHVDSAGTFTATFKSDSLKEYRTEIIKNLFVESGDEEALQPVTLKDTVPPVLLVSNIDTLRERTLDLTVYARDLGTLIDSVWATLNGESLKISYGKMKGESVFNGKISLTELKDGTHKLVYNAKDLAGNVTKLEQSLIVDATALKLDVNGSQKDVISSTEKLVFTATILNALPPADSVTWSWDIEGESKTLRTKVDEAGIATLTLEYIDVSSAVPDKDYLMSVSFQENGVSLEKQVKFGVLGTNPVIAFMEPGALTTVTINDPVHFVVKAIKGLTSSTTTISWNCGTKLSSGYSCPTSEEEATLAFSEVGTYKIIASITDDLDNKGADTVVVEVIKDPPTIKATTQAQDNRYKIHAKVNVRIIANDKFGNIEKIRWGCDNNNVLSLSSEKIISPAAKSVTDSVEIILPGTDTENWICKFAAIDDDNEADTTELKFIALLDKPTVTLATKSETVKINSVIPIKAIAHDELGYIAEYNIACDDNQKDLDNPEWTVMPGPETSVKMPPTATDKYYCKVMVKDDDGNEATDMATYKVVVGRPTVTAMLPTAFETVTIKDTIEVSAIAKDSLGTLVKYEWGCGPAGSDNIGFTTVSTSTPFAKLVMPSTPQDNYLCIVRVTDDDGNSAKDSITTKVILAPPTVTVEKKTLTIRQGYNITLNATATDRNNVTSDPGEIVKREWSCGTPEQIAQNWKTVSAYDTVWKAPAPEATYYCIARATDNDGNMATDTMDLKFSTELPLIWVKDELIYINVGDEFSLNATVNDVWQGINWFTWECVSKKDGKSLEKSVPKYSYEKNNKSFAITKDSSYSEKGVDMYCIVSAEEASTKATFSDTTEVRLLEQHPKGAITAADTVYLWSGDEAVDDEAIYFYTKEWGGMNSQLGELGDKNNQDFYWRFSNINSSSFYQGNPDGSLDTSTAEFNSAFIRRQTEGSMTISLDYRDSVSTQPTYGFLARHRSEEVSRTVYFRKAWENLSKDTVLAQSTMNTAPAMIMLNDIPVIAYLSSKNNIKAVALKNGSWSDIAEVIATDSVTAIRLATDGTDLYMGALDKTGAFSVYKSTKGTSDFAAVGGTIADVSSPRLLCNPTTKAPVLVYINKTKKLNYLATLSGSTWNSTNIISFVENEKTMKFREITAEFASSGVLAVVAIDTTSDYRATSALFSNSYSQLSISKNFASNVNGVSLAAIGSNVYMGFLNRDVNTYGPYVYKGAISGNNLTWKKDGIYSKPIFEGYIAYHISLAAFGDNIYAAIDDNGRPYLAQTHVFRLDGTKWHFHGENQLPYFSAVFYNNNGYYLRGSNPMLAVNSDGKVFLSMLARENAGGSTKNNGPMLMKFVADTWEIH